MKLLSFIFILALSVASAREALIPSGEITAETPSLETAYPGETYIMRSIKGDVISYEVRVYAPEVIDLKRMSTLADVVVSIRGGTGAPLFSGTLKVEGICTIPPSKEKFRMFCFSIHKSVETTTVINIGRDNFLRELFTPYRLPLTTIDHPKAHR